MKETLSYVLLTPYTVAKSRTGGVVSRLLSQSDLSLVGAQMIAADKKFAYDYAESLRGQTRPEFPSAMNMLATYVERNIGPSGGRPHRTLMLIFRGVDPCKKLSDVCGALYAENRSIESFTGETIRDTFADLIYDKNNTNRITYFEPAVLTPRIQEHADSFFRLLAPWLPGQPNIIENVIYPNPDKVERTLVIIKPDNWKYASSRPGTILDMFSRTGLRIVGVKVMRLSVAQAMEFYGPVKENLKTKLAGVFAKKGKELIEKSFDIELSPMSLKIIEESFGTEYAVDQFEQIVEFMSGSRPSKTPVEKLEEPGSVKCMILVYEGENATAKIRDVLGPTDPLKAPEGTIRRELGTDIMVNTAHASDSVESASREMNVVEFHTNDCSEIVKSYVKLL
ncbi:MAG: nucleoside-diphosphate kinase [Sphaerochaetaceae bacterium]